MIEVDYKIMVMGTNKGQKQCAGGTTRIKTMGLNGYDEIELRQESSGKIVGLRVEGGQDERHCVQDDSGAGGGLQLGFVAGVILRGRLPAFEKMLWRACRGNVFLRVAEIEDPLEDPNAGDEVLKSVFVIFFQGRFLQIKRGSVFFFIFF